MPKQPRPWARQYLPGYTGHVPSKNELFGKTAGSINKDICIAGGQADNLGRLALKESMAGTSNLPTSAKMNKDVFGNWSRYSKNWVCGPTHNVRQQHCPGYTGHVRGMVSADSLSKSYARVTAHLFSRNHPISDETSNKGRFMSTQRNEYRVSNNRRFAADKSLIPRKDYDDYAKYVNDTQQARRSAVTSMTTRVVQTARVTRTSMGTRTQREPLDLLTVDTPNMFNARSTVHGGSVTAQMKPRILESKVGARQEFFGLSDGFKRIFADDKKDRKLIIPVVGYGGHRRGDRSQNYFGKSFRDTTIQSKQLEREFRSTSLAN